MSTNGAISARICVRRAGSACMWRSSQKAREAGLVLMLYRGISRNRRGLAGVDGTYAQRRLRSQAALTPGLASNLFQTFRLSFIKSVKSPISLHGCLASSPLETASAALWKDSNAVSSLRRAMCALVKLGIPHNLENPHFSHLKPPSRSHRSPTTVGLISKNSVPTRVG